MAGPPVTVRADAQNDGRPITATPRSSRRGDDGGLVDVGGESDERLEPGRHTLDAHGRHAFGERGDEQVAAAPVRREERAEVTVVATRAQQVGEGQLVDDRHRRPPSDDTAATVGSTRSGGRTHHPSRSPGASDLLAVPA